jgi:hypothetical protein
LGEARVKMADAKRMNARTNASPGSTLELVDDTDIDIEPVDAPLACIGNQYIRSIAKFITAWINQ